MTVYPINSSVYLGRSFLHFIIFRLLGHKGERALGGGVEIDFWRRAIISSILGLSSGMLLLLNSSLNGVFINSGQSCNIRREENPKSNIFRCTSHRLMPWHDDIIQLKGWGMKKLVPDGKSVHCTQPWWSPWRGSRNLRVWIHPEGPLNSTCLSWRSHTGPSQWPMCAPRWNLLCPAATAVLRFHLPTSSPPPALPIQLSTGVLPKWVEMWGVCPGVARLFLAFPVLWEQAVGLSSASGYLLAALSDHKTYLTSPTQPCPVMPWTQAPFIQSRLIFFLSHTDYMVQTNSPGRNLDFNRDKFRAKQNKSLSYDTEDLCQAFTQD